MVGTVVTEPDAVDNLEIAETDFTSASFTWDHPEVGKFIVRVVLKVWSICRETYLSGFKLLFTLWDSLHGNIFQRKYHPRDEVFSVNSEVNQNFEKSWVSQPASA